MTMSYEELEAAYLAKCEEVRELQSAAQELVNKITIWDEPDKELVDNLRKALEPK